MTVLQCSVLLDTYLYNNQFTVAPLRFYSANVTKGYATLFGVQPWYWGLTQVILFLTFYFYVVVAIYMPNYALDVVIFAYYYLEFTCLTMRYAICKTQLRCIYHWYLLILFIFRRYQRCWVCTHHWWSLAHILLQTWIQKRGKKISAILTRYLCMYYRWQCNVVCLNKLCLHLKLFWIL